MICLDLGDYDVPDGGDDGYGNHFNNEKYKYAIADRGDSGNPLKDNVLSTFTDKAAGYFKNPIRDRRPLDAEPWFNGVYGGNPAYNCQQVIECLKIYDELESKYKLDDLTVVKDPRVNAVIGGFNEFGKQTACMMNNPCSGTNPQWPDPDIVK